MFRAMIDVTAWAVAISFLAFILAFFAEGRGTHLLRVLLGLAPRRQGLEAFSSVPRDDGDWRLVAALEEPTSRVRPRDAASDTPVSTPERSGAPA